jgi:phosphate transport system substrate-binding protein
MTRAGFIHRHPRRGVAGLLLLWSCLCASPLAARDQVRVTGSSTLFPFASAVAETFRSQGRWKTPVVESLGTGGGFKLFCAGIGEATPDITDASRPMTSTEVATCEKNGVGNVVGIRVGMDGMLLVNARAGPAFALTREQLYRAVARSVPAGGRLVPNPYRRWKDIAPQLPDLPIRIYGPAPNHGTRDAFVALAMMPPCERQPEIRVLSAGDRQQNCQRIREDGAWIDVSGDYAVLFGRLLADPTALGVLGFSWLDRNRDRIKAAPIDGIEPTSESISAWTYPLARPLFIYVKQAHVGRIPGLSEFVQEFLSDRAIGPRGYLVEQGLMPLPEAGLSLERAKVQRMLAPAGK